MLIKFILYFLVFYALWQVVKFVFRVMLLSWIRKNAGKTFQYQGNFGGPFAGNSSRPVGDIRVETPGKSSGKNVKSHDDGDYVDFEEVS